MCIRFVVALACASFIGCTGVIEDPTVSSAGQAELKVDIFDPASGSPRSVESELLPDQTIRNVLPLERFGEARVELKLIRDGAELALDPDRVEWRVGNALICHLIEAGDKAFLVGLSDRFDAETDPLIGAPGAEPETALTVRYGDHIGDLAIKVVVDLTGVWNMAFDSGRTLQFVFVQHGRRVTDQHKDNVVGDVTRDALLMGYGPYDVLSGNFGTRDRLIGAYVDIVGGHGTFEAVKAKK